jgi:hypothetical protein
MGLGLQAARGGVACGGTNMIKRLLGLLTAVVVIALSMPPSAAATSAEDPFEYLYGTEAKRILAARDPKASAEFAARLVADAESTITDPAVKAAVYQKAYEFGLAGPQGYATAATAMTQLAALVPEKNAECQEKLLAIMLLQLRSAATEAERARVGPQVMEQLVTVAELQVAAGNGTKAAENCRQAQNMLQLAPTERRGVLQAKLKTLAATAAALQQADQLKAQLKADPQNKVVAAKLLRLYLVDMDNPVEAVKYADPGADDLTHKRLLVAGMSPATLPENALLSLAEWYKDLADSVAGDAKTAMLRRAKLYGEQFLRVHADEDLARTKAATILARVSEALAAQTPVPPKPPPGPPKLPLRINCGGSEIVDSKKNTWLADQAYAPGMFWGYLGAGSKIHHLDDADVAEVARDERVGEAIAYRFELPNRKYALHLGFFDGASKATDERVFAIEVQGQVAQRAYDVYKVTSGKRATLDLAVRSVAVTNGVLQFRLIPIKGVPAISYIEVVPE